MSSALLSLANVQLTTQLFADADVGAAASIGVKRHSPRTGAERSEGERSERDGNRENDSSGVTLICRLPANRVMY